MIDSWFDSRFAIEIGFYLIWFNPVQNLVPFVLRKILCYLYVQWVDVFTSTRCSSGIGVAVASVSVMWSYSDGLVIVVAVGVGCLAAAGAAGLDFLFVVFFVLLVLSGIVLFVRYSSWIVVVAVASVVGLDVLHWGATNALYELFFCVIMIRLVLGLILVLEKRQLISDVASLVAVLMIG